MWFVGWVIISCGFMVIKYNNAWWCNITTKRPNENTDLMSVFGNDQASLISAKKNNLKDTKTFKGRSVCQQ